MTTTIPTTVQIDILKISTCGKVTLPDDHTLTYDIGYDAALKTLLVRITDNDIGGLFSNEWIAITDILTTIEKRHKQPLGLHHVLITYLFGY